MKDISEKIAAKDIFGRGLSKNDFTDNQKLKLISTSFPLSDQPVAGRLVMPQQGFYSAVNPTLTYRSMHLLTNESSLVRLQWVNSSFDGTVLNPFVLTASIQYCPLGSTNPSTVSLITLTFGGQSSITIPNKGYAINDPIWLPAVPGGGGFFLVRTCCSSTFSSNNWPRGLFLSGGYNGVATGDQTANISAVFSSAGVGYAPSLIVSPSDDTFSICGAGDSIMDGSADRVNNRGYFGMFIEDNKLSGNRAAVPGERVSSAVVRWTNRWIYSQASTHVLCEYGTNDIYSGDTLEVVQANSISFWRHHKLMKKKVMQTTIIPRNTSSNFWKDVQGQAVASQESVRVAFNNWLRAGAPCIVNGYSVIPTAANEVNAVKCPFLDYTVDICSVVEVNTENVLTVNGGFWKSPGRTKTGNVTSATSNTLTDSSGGFAAIKPSGGLVSIVSGLGEGQNILIDGNPSGSDTQINLLTNFTTVPNSTSVYEIWDVPTPDGVHPSTNTHSVIAEHLKLLLPTWI